MKREPLPNRRSCVTSEFVHDRLNYTATVGFYYDGRPGEIFLDSSKAGTSAQNNARDAAVIASLALQHGVPIKTMRHAITRNQDGTPAGPIGTLLDDLERNTPLDPEPAPLPDAPTPPEPAAAALEVPA